MVMIDTKSLNEIGLGVELIFASVIWEFRSSRLH